MGVSKLVAPSKTRAYKVFVVLNVLNMAQGASPLYIPPEPVASVPPPNPICWKPVAPKVAAHSMADPSPKVREVLVLNLAPSTVNTPPATVEVPPVQGKLCHSLEGRVSNSDATAGARITLFSSAARYVPDNVPRAKSSAVASCTQGSTGGSGMVKESTPGGVGDSALLPAASIPLTLKS